MKNKIVLILIFLLFCGQSIYAKEKDTAKLIAGILLTAAGGVVAYNGFQPVDVSFPDLSMASFATVTAGTTITTDGTIKNTGNVGLKNVKVTVIYKNSSGAEITDSTVDYSGTIAPDASEPLYIGPMDIGTEPYFFSVEYRADFNRLYENNSVSTGIAGSVMIAGGIFLICDYFFDFSDFFEQKGVSVGLAAVNNGLSFTAAKAF